MKVKELKEILNSRNDWDESNIETDGNILAIEQVGCGEPYLVFRSGKEYEYDKMGKKLYKFEEYSPDGYKEAISKAGSMSELESMIRKWFYGETENWFIYLPDGTTPNEVIYILDKMNVVYDDSFEWDDEYVIKFTDGIRLAMDLGDLKIRLYR